MPPKAKKGDDEVSPEEVIRGHLKNLRADEEKIQLDAVTELYKIDLNNKSLKVQWDPLPLAHGRF